MKKRFEKTWGSDSKTEDQRGSSKIVFIGAMFADVLILAFQIVLGGGRQRQEKKKKYSFLPALQNTQRE